MQVPCYIRLVKREYDKQIGSKAKKIYWILSGERNSEINFGINQNGINLIDDKLC